MKHWIAAALLAGALPLHAWATPDQPATVASDGNYVQRLNYQTYFGDYLANSSPPKNRKNRGQKTGEKTGVRPAPLHLPRGVRLASLHLEHPLRPAAWATLRPGHSQPACTGVD